MIKNINENSHQEIPELNDRDDLSDISEMIKGLNHRADELETPDKTPESNSKKNKLEDFGAYATHDENTPLTRLRLNSMISTTSCNKFD